MADIGSLTVPLSIPVPASWNPWTIISANQVGNRRPFDDAFPEDFLPTDSVAFAHELSNELLDITTRDFTAQSVLGTTGPVGASLGPFILTGSLLNLTLSRTGNTAVIANQPVGLANASPRVGFQVGNLFKHQAYFKVRLEGIGEGTSIQNVHWRQIIPTEVSVEYASNSRFKRMYARHGKLLDVNPSTSHITPSGGGTPYDETKLTLQLFRRAGAPPANFLPPGSELIIINAASGVRNYDIKQVLDDWRVELIFRTPPDPLPGTIEKDDFWALRTPWMFEDPALLHEYELNVDGDGLYRTNEQRSSLLNSDLIGVWVREEVAGLGLLWVAYANEADRNGFYLPRSDAEAVRRQEGRAFGGNLAAGLNLLNNASASTIRLTLFPLGSPSTQNFCAGNLTGELVRFATTTSGAQPQYYEVMSQPRGDTVEVSNQSLSTDHKLISNLLSNLLANAAARQQFHVYQQNYWFLNEIHPSAGLVAGQSQTRGPTTGLWHEPVETVSYNTAANETTVRWKARHVDGGRLSGGEAQRTGAGSLDERCRLTLHLPGAVALPLYRKFAGWLLRNSSKGVSHAIKQFPPTTPPSNGTFQADPVAFSVVLAGNQSASLIGDRVYVTFGDPFPTLLTSPEAAHFVSMQFAPTTKYDSDGRLQAWKILMEGYYDAGRYRFPFKIPVGSRYSLVSHAFGYNPDADFPLGRPAEYVAGARGLSSLTACEPPLSGRQHVFFGDAGFDDILVVRSGSYGWVRDRRQILVRAGYPNVLDAGTAVPPQARAITNLVFNMQREAPPRDEFHSAHWLHAPGGFFGSRIQGNGTVETVLTRRFNLVQNAAASPILLPYEFMAPGSTQSPATGTDPMDVPAYMPASFPVAQAGLQKIDLATQISAMLNGTPPSPGTIAYAPVRYDYAKSTQLVSEAPLKSALSLTQSRLLLAYGSSLPASAAMPSGGTGLFLLASDDGGNVWGSPRLSRPDQSSAQAAEWSTPLVVLAGFDFVTALFDAFRARLYFFGYVHESGHEGNPAHLSIAMYSLALSELALSTVTPLTGTGGEVAANFRQPLIDPSTPAAAGVPEGTSQASTGEERFIKVLGNPASLAQVRSQSLQDDLFTVEQYPNRSLRLFFQEADSKQVRSVSSTDQGQTWRLDLDISAPAGPFPPMAYAEEAEAPFANGEHLFYFRGTRLQVRTMRGLAVGNLTQQAIDAVPAVTVADGVEIQKIAALQDGQNNLYVWYVKEGGQIIGLSSHDDGQKWRTLVNW